ncbi:hypothetical protein [Bradyrhizobium sp. R2.2-H]|nr:hypothetical protein [Bradyrhizobium sp. R2.2-H]
MTHKIPKSFLQIAKDRGVIVDVPSDVTRFLGEINAWFEREREVKAQPVLPPKPQWHDYENAEDPAAEWGKANANWSQLARHHKDPFPRPSAHPYVEASVRYDEAAGKFVEDYEIVDDGPTPDQILAAKKADLIAKIEAAEVAARDAVALPSGKQRLEALTVSVIAATDKAFVDKLIKDTAPADLAKLNVTALVENNRSDEQKAFLADQAAREAKLARIDETAAIAMSSVEDLTVGNVDSFEIPSFEH